jgi:hypothetical protein
MPHAMTSVVQPVRPTNRYRAFFTVVVACALAAPWLAACGDDGTTDTGATDTASDTASDTTGGETDGTTGDGTGTGTDTGPATDGDTVSDPDSDSGSDSGSETTGDDTGVALPWPECGTGQYTGRYLVAGPAETAFDPALDKKARQYDRQHHAFSAVGQGLTTDVSVALARGEDRAVIEKFLRENDGWDIGAVAPGKSAADLVDGWAKVAGLYGGVGVAADAMRYATLRNQGAPCAEVDVARAQFKQSLATMHLAFTLPGVPGVVARGWARKTTPGAADTLTVTPLFDNQGQPLPAEKSNGTWRADNSGQFPDYIWEDSCSRDMLLGWATAAGVAAEVIRGDPTIDDSLKATLRADAKDMVDALSTVRESGYDLEIPDADGRTTYHGYINEHCIERCLTAAAYLPSVKNPFYAMMALGIVGAFAYASEDEQARAYLLEELVANRRLHLMARDAPSSVNVGTKTNFSNVNMIFGSAWLALRYVDDPAAYAAIRAATANKLYVVEGGPYVPSEQKQSLYDFIYAAAESGASATVEPEAPAPATALANGLVTLAAFPEPPYWNRVVENCDGTELESKACTLDNGDNVTVLAGGGRGDTDICTVPVPKAVRRPSNYEWRSNPYEANGGGEGSGLLPGVDFRFAYWLGRFTRVAE